MAAAVLLVTCADQGPTGPAVGLARAGMDLTGLVRAGSHLPIPLDSLRIRVRRKDSSLAYDRALWANASAVRSNQDTIAITLDIPLLESPETFAFYVGAEGGGVVYYEVSGTISVSAGGRARTPEMVPAYVGPGALADSVTMSLSVPAAPGGDSVLATAQVWQAGSVIPGVPVGFTSSDTLKLNQIHPSGLNTAWIVAPLSLTDSVDITANTPTGLTAARRLAFAPAPALLALASGDGQTIPVAQAAALPLMVQARNAAGLPYPLGQPVVFAVASGPAGTSVAPLVDTTDALGFAQTTLTAGTTVGQVQVTATAVGLAGSPVTFSATVTSGTGGVPDTVVIISGNNQTAANGTPLSAPLVVEVRDQFGVPVQGVSVAWSPIQGSANPPSATTDVAGRAQTSWTLGSGSSSQSLTASVTGLTPAVFNATATFASPAVLLSFPTVPGVGIGLSNTISVGLTSPAGVGGVTVAVTSDAPGIVSIGGTGAVFIPQNQTTGTITINGVSLGTTTVRGNATGFTEGTLSVDVQDRSISLPTTLNVPYGQTASLPIQLASPAPPGGVTFTVASSNTTFVGVGTPTVFIAAGSLTGNATLQGILPGPSTVTVSNPGYITGNSTVNTTASLNITQSAVGLNASFGTTININFESNGSGIAAPAPGIAVTLAPVDPTCLSVTSPVTIVTGLVSTTASLTYAGTATLPCTTLLRATAPNLQPDSVSVTVSPVPGITVNGLNPTGAGLMEVGAVFLGASNHGGIVVTLKSSDPSVVRVSANPSTPGTDSIQVTVLNGNSSFNYEIQGIEGQTGSATITASAAGFTNGTAIATIVQPGIEVQGLPTSTTTFSADNQFYAQVGVPNGQNTGLAYVQNVRPGVTGGGFIATFVSDTPSVGTLVNSLGTGATRTALVPSGQYYSPTTVVSGGVGFHPLTTGTTFVSATSPGFIQMTNTGVRQVDVTQPGITVGGLNATGAGLMETGSVFLGATNHGGVTVTVKSSNPGVVLVSSNPSTPGTDSIQISVLNGNSSFSYYVQGVEGTTGTATITVSAPGFSNGTGSVTIVPPGVELQGLPGSTTTLSADNQIYVQVGVPNGQNTGLAYVQNVRPGVAGGGFTATFVSDTPSVGTLVNSAGTGATRTALVASGLYYSPTSVATGGIGFHPLTTGTTFVSGTIPGFIQMTTTGIRRIDVSQPVISVNGLSPTGAGLMEQGAVFLSASNHGGVTVTVKSSNPGVTLVSPNSSTPGTDSIQVSVPNGSTSFGYFIQGVEGTTGTSTISATSPLFGSGSTNVTIVQPGVEIQGIPASTTTLSPDNDFYVQVGVPNGQNTGLAYVQNVRAGISGGALTATLNNSVSAVATLITQSGAGSQRTVQVPAGLYYSPTSLTSGGVSFHPILAGTTVVTGDIPGFTRMTVTGLRTVTVSQPAITVGGLNPTGSGLMETGNVFLGAANHGGVTVTIKSSNPSVVRVSPNGSTPGTDSIQVSVPNGTTSFNYVIQGIEGQTGTVSLTASASGFTNGSSTVTIVQPAVELQGVPTSTTTLSNISPFYAQVGVANGQNTGLSYVQSVRPGIAGGGLTVTFVSGTPSVGDLVDTLGNGATRTATVLPGFYYTPTSVASGGVGFRPLSQGTTIVRVTIPGFLQTTTNGVRQVDVTQPGISMNGLNPTGAGLMDISTVFLNAGNHGGAVITIKSSNPSVVLVSPNSTTPGTDSIQISIPNNTTAFNYFIQGVEGTTGAATITATEPRFSSGSTTATIVQPGVEIQGLVSSIQAGAADNQFYAQVGVPNFQHSGLSYVQNVRPGISGGGLTATFTSSQVGFGALVTQAGVPASSQTAVITPGLYYTPTSVGTGGVAFRPVAAGNIDVSVNVSGLIQMIVNGVRTVTVTP